MAGGFSGNQKSKEFLHLGTGASERKMVLAQLPAAKSKRVNGEKYLHKGNVCMWWHGKLCCEHGRQKPQCKECGGSAICEHGRQKSTCKECGGSGICEHGRQKSRCKECGGSGICEHGRQKRQCKECCEIRTNMHSSSTGGSGRCE